MRNVDCKFECGGKCTNANPKAGTKFMFQAKGCVESYDFINCEFADRFKRPSPPCAPPRLDNHTIPITNGYAFSEAPLGYIEAKASSLLVRMKNPIPKDEVFNIFGNAAIRVSKFTESGGVMYLSEFEIVSFSHSNEPALGMDTVDRVSAACMEHVRSARGFTPDGFNSWLSDPKAFVKVIKDALAGE